MMNDIPRQKLREIISQQGTAVCEQPHRLKALLHDQCGAYRKEIAVLITALEARIPQDLLSSQNSLPAGLLLARLIKRLQDNFGLSSDAAHWAVESWALALGTIASASSPSDQIRPSQEQPRSRQSNELQATVITPSATQVQPVGNPARSPDHLSDHLSDHLPNHLLPAAYASFGSRTAALLIDGVILYILGFLSGFLLAVFYALLTESTEGVEPLAYLLGIVLNWLYFALQESSVKQATIGKRAMNIYVTDLNGSRLSLSQATSRHFSKILSAVLCIGFIMAAFTQRKQALHDLIAKTLVVQCRSHSSVSSQF
jgi:uncharacterized RDD family membrane protein YckC